MQEKHIRKTIRDYLKPFRYFLGAIGRFPYTEEKETQKLSIVQAIKKTSCAPILEMGLIQDQVKKDEETQFFKYDPKSGRGIIFTLSTILSVIILTIALFGYVDMNMTEHKFRDIIEKEINGELSCFNKTVNFKNEQIIRKTKQALFAPLANGFYEEMIFAWNCSHAAKVLRNCHPFHSEFSETDEKIEQERVKNCEISVKLKNSVDGSLIFLVVIFACLLNTILQSWIPIFKGNFPAYNKKKLDLPCF